MSKLDDFDDLHFPRTEEPEINRLIADDLNRRGFLQKSVGAGFATFFGGLGFGQDEAVAPVDPAKPLLGFPPVSACTLDKVTLPDGYEEAVLISWGIRFSRTRRSFARPPTPPNRSGSSEITTMECTCSR